MEGSIKFTEAKLEQAIIELLGEQGFTHVLGETLVRKNNEQVLITDDLRTYLASQYQADDITSSEIDSIIRQLATLPATDLYDSNKTFCHWLANGFLFKREDRNKKDLYIELIDTQHLPATHFDRALRNCNTPEDWIALQQSATQARSG